MPYRDKQILLIDYQEGTRQKLAATLRRFFKVTVAQNKSEGLRMAAALQPDLVVINPQDDTFPICAALRSHPVTCQSIVLLLMSDDSVERRIRAYSRGADDTIEPRCTDEELIARIESKLRLASIRAAPKKALSIRCGNVELTLDKDRRIIKVDGDVRKLTAIESRLLHLMVERKNEIVTRKDFLKLVWNSQKVSARTIDTHMSALRRKLDGFDHSINMAYGSGYILQERTKMARPEGVEPPGS